jgi:hypothetical protein
MCLRSNNIIARRLPALVFIALVVIGSWLDPQAQEPGRNQEAQKLKNPEPTTVESVEALSASLRFVSRPERQRRRQPGVVRRHSV